MTQTSEVEAGLRQLRETTVITHLEAENRPGESGDITHSFPHGCRCCA
jgi:hypothetical protein